MMLHFDGFNSYNVSADICNLNANYTQNDAGNVAFSATGARFSGGVFITTGAAQGLDWFLESEPSDVWTSISIYPNANNVADNQIIGFNSDNGLEVIITYNYSTGLFKAITPSGPVTLGSMFQGMSANVWHRLEARALIAGGTSGSVELWLDNKRVFNITGVNTATLGGSAVASTTIGNIGTTHSHNAFQATYCDWADNDLSGTYNNGRLGDGAIGLREPIGDTQINDGTPSTPGPHYPMVNEPQYETTNSIALYNMSEEEELYQMSTLVVPATAVLACRVIAIVKTDAVALATYEDSYPDYASITATFNATQGPLITAALAALETANAAYNTANLAMITAQANTEFWVARVESAQAAYSGNPTELNLESLDANNAGLLAIEGAAQWTNFKTDPSIADAVWAGETITLQQAALAAVVAAENTLNALTGASPTYPGGYPTPPDTGPSIPLTGETVIVSVASEADGPSTNVQQTPCLIDGISESDPNTSLAWSLAGVNASQCGFRISTTAMSSFS